MRRPRGVVGPALLASLLVLPLAACELEETVLAEPDEVVVAEALVQVGVIGDRLTVFLHRTLDGGGRSAPVPGAEITLTTNRGEISFLQESDRTVCVSGFFPENRLDGTCYLSDPFSGPGVFAGDRLEMEIVLPDGRSMTASGRVPGAYDLLRPEIVDAAVGDTCSLAPLTPLPAVWSTSREARTYLVEVTIEGIRDALAPEVRPLVEDPLFLLGLSISEQDTTITIPGEVGVFDRFELEREVAVLLQDGLPEGTVTTVVLGAADRNLVNWIRGGNFNPSGEVRIPSFRGDGTGVLGSVVRRSWVIVAEEEPFAHAPCIQPPEEP